MGRVYVQIFENRFFSPVLLSYYDDHLIEMYIFLKWVDLMHYLKRRVCYLIQTVGVALFSGFLTPYFAFQKYC